MEPGSASGGLRHSVVGRGLLSFVFVFHFLAVFVYLLPSERETYEDMPERIRGPALAIAAPIIYNLTPWTQPWLNATWARQNWQLFAPWPSSWNVSGTVVAWFPVDSTEFLADRRWQADTIIMPSGESDPYPHINQGRKHRVVMTLGEAGPRSSFPSWMARSWCASATDEAGRSPEGIEFHVVWAAIRRPWDDEVEPPYDQLIGGFNCWEFADRARPWWSRPHTDPMGLAPALRSPFLSSPQ